MADIIVDEITSYQARCLACGEESESDLDWSQADAWEHECGEGN